MLSIWSDLKRDCKTIGQDLKDSWLQVLGLLAALVAVVVLFGLYMGASDEVFERWIRPGMGLVTVVAFLGFVIVMAMHADLRCKR